MSKQYELEITYHAKERWVKRILSPQLYEHLEECQRQNCDRCAELKMQLLATICLKRKEIDGTILRKYKEAKLSGSWITHPLYLEAVRKVNPGYASRSEYLDVVDAVLVLGKDPEKNRHVVITVFEPYNLENFLSKMDKRETPEMTFARWKREAKKNIWSN